MSQTLRSRFPHLSALLQRNGAAQAPEYLLESDPQQDRLRADHAGVVISLLAIARIFFDEHEYDHARERIRQALPLADACWLRPRRRRREPQRGVSGPLGRLFKLRVRG